MSIKGPVPVTMGQYSGAYCKQQECLLNLLFSDALWRRSLSLLLSFKPLQFWAGRFLDHGPWSLTPHRPAVLPCMGGEVLGNSTSTQNFAGDKIHPPATARLANFRISSAGREGQRNTPGRPVHHPNCVVSSALIRLLGSWFRLSPKRQQKPPTWPTQRCR